MQSYRLTHMLARRPGPLSGFSNSLRSPRPSSTPTSAPQPQPPSTPVRSSSPYPAIPPAGIASFSTTQPSLAKKNKKGKKSDNSNNPDASSSKPEIDEDDQTSVPLPDPTNPTDFPDLDFRFLRAGDRFSELIRKLRSGQTSIAVDEISSVRVRPDKESASTYPLRELATVVPRSGRLISILVHESTYVKPVMSAIQSSDSFNQQPQRSEENELELSMKMARESPEKMASRVRDAAHVYKEAVRQARQKREKIHQKWLKEGTWLPDQKFKADKDLQKKVDKKNGEIEKLEVQTLKNIASMREE